jgi:hypothetical protein
LLEELESNTNSVAFSTVIALKNAHDYKLMQVAYETQIESHQAQIEGLKKYTSEK